MIKQTKGPSSLGIVTEKITEKRLFQNLIFWQDDAFVSETKIVNKLFKEEDRKIPEWWANSPDPNRKPREIKENLKKKGQNQDPDVLKNLFENFINCLAYIRNNKSVISRY